MRSQAERTRSLVAIALVGLLSAILASASPAPLRIEGSTTLFPVVRDWTAGFGQRRPDLQISLEAGGTTAGLAALLDGGADLALASRPIRAEESALAVERGIRLRTIEVARDALSIIVHHDNPIAALTRDQVRGLFTGRLSGWDAVGGPPRPVTVVVRNPESHTGQFFREQLLDRQTFAAGSVITANRQEMVARIAADEWAIGFAGLADAVNSEQRELVKAIRLQLDDPLTEEPERGVEVHSVYAISRPLFFVVRSPLSPAVEAFVEFVLSPEGQALIVKSNFFPIGVSESPGVR